MIQIRKVISLALLLGASLAMSAHAAVIWDEAVNGDLSSVTNAASATELGTLTDSSNTIIGTLDGGTSTVAGTDEYDLFRFTVGDSWSLDFDSLSFSGDFPRVLLYDYGNSQTAGSFDVAIADAISRAAGTWAFGLIPQANRGTVSYTLSINLDNASAVPAPLGAPLALIALVLLGLRRRAR
jgi:hypothetical protein